MAASQSAAKSAIMSAIEAILPRASDLSLYELEQYCVDTLEYDKGSEQSQNLLKGHKTYQILSKNPIKAQEAASIQAGSASGAAHTEIRNHQLRFNIPRDRTPRSPKEEQNGEGQVGTVGKPSSAIKPKRRLSDYISEVFGGSSNGGDILDDDYENVTDESLLSAPIVDICVVMRNESPPAGYYRIAKTLKLKKANLNTSSGGTSCYLCIKKERDAGSPKIIGEGGGVGLAPAPETLPVVAVQVIFPDRGEFMPMGFQVVMHMDQTMSGNAPGSKRHGKRPSPCNLNTGTNAERVFLCFKKEVGGNPITDLQPLFPSLGEATPPDYNLLDRSSSGKAANLNSMTGGVKVYLCYRQVLRNLLPLKGMASAVSKSTLSSGGSRGRMVSSSEGSVDTEEYPQSPGVNNNPEDGERRRSGSGSSRASHVPSFAWREGVVQGNSVLDSNMTTSNTSSGSDYGSPSPRKNDGGGREGPGQGETAANGEEKNPAKGEEENPANGEEKNPARGDAEDRLSIRIDASLSRAFHSDEESSLSDDEEDSEDEDEDRAVFDERYVRHSMRLSQDLSSGDGFAINSKSKRRQLIVDCYGVPRDRSTCKWLLVLLTALYSSHRAIVDTALCALIRLLKHSTYFDADFVCPPQPGTLTLTQITIEAMCDRLELGMLADVKYVLYFLRLLAIRCKGSLPSVATARLFKSVHNLIGNEATSDEWLRQGGMAPTKTYEYSPASAIKPAGVGTIGAGLPGLGSGGTGASVLNLQQEGVLSLTLNQDTGSRVGDNYPGVLGGAEADGGSVGVEPTLTMNEHLQLEVSDASLDGLSVFEVLMDTLACFTKPLELLLDYHQASLQQEGANLPAAMAPMTPGRTGAGNFSPSGLDLTPGTPHRAEDITRLLNFLPRDDTDEGGGYSVGYDSAEVSIDGPESRASIGGGASGYAPDYSDPSRESETWHMAESLVLELLDETTNNVEIAILLEGARKVVSRQSFTSGSASFWGQVTIIAKLLFLQPQMQSVLMLLCGACKMSWVSLRAGGAASSAGNGKKGGKKGTDGGNGPSGGLGNALGTPPPRIGPGNGYANRREAATRVVPSAARGVRGAPNMREYGQKVVGLELMAAFLSRCRETVRTSKIMGYCVRRLVVPCIMFNVPAALADHRLFARVLAVLTCLWKHWRSHVRMEIAVLVESIVIGTIMNDNRPIFRMMAVQEVSKWFDQPQLMVEMFVNYDMEITHVGHWNVFSHVVRSICSTARKISGRGAVDTSIGGDLASSSADAGDAALDGASVSHTSAAISDHEITVDSVSCAYYALDEHVAASITARNVYIQALEEVCRVSKTIMDASGHAYLLHQDNDFRKRSLGLGLGWEEDDEGDGAEDDEDQGLEGPTPGLSTTPATPATSDTQLSAGTGRIGSKYRNNRSVKRGKTGTIATRRATHIKKEGVLAEAMRRYASKRPPSVKKAVDYLVEQSFVSSDPQEIASFLRIYKQRFEPEAIGEYLGQEGLHFEQLRFRYIRATSFAEMNIEPALRLFLTGCGFKLPGEGQKVHRFVECFEKVYWTDNSNTPQCPFHESNTVFLISYAIIMLNSDHHRANVGKRAKAKMSKEAFLRNLDMALASEDAGYCNLAPEYLGNIFDSVESNPIELVTITSGGSAEDSGRPKKRDSIFGLPTLQSFSRGRDGHARPQAAQLGDHTRNGNAGEASSASLQDDTAPGQVHHRGRQSSFSNPLLGETVVFDPKEECERHQRAVGFEMQDGEDMLRGMRNFSYRFQLTGQHINISLDLVSFMYETVWAHHKNISGSLLCSLDGDMFVTFLALDLLSHNLTSSIFLGLREERDVLAKQLLDFQMRYCMANTLEDASGSRTTSTSVAWYDQVLNHRPEARMDVISRLHKLIVHLKDECQEVSNKALTVSVATRIEGSEEILERNAYFVREGVLGKVSQRKGNVKQYSFFLFSDELLYGSTHMSMSSLLGSTVESVKKHGQLSLSLMTVTDMESDPTRCSLYIDHPFKSFILQCPSPLLKNQWLRDITQTINNCNMRQVVREEEEMEHAASQKLSATVGPAPYRGGLRGSSELHTQADFLRNVVSPVKGAFSGSDGLPEGGGSSDTSLGQPNTPGSTISACSDVARATQTTHTGSTTRASGSGDGNSPHRVGFVEDGNAGDAHGPSDDDLELYDDDIEDPEESEQAEREAEELAAFDSSEDEEKGGSMFEEEEEDEDLADL